MVRLDTIIYYVFYDEIQNYTFILCIDCFDNNDMREYKEENKTVVFYGITLEGFPVCEYCNSEIKEGINLIWLLTRL